VRRLNHRDIRDRALTTIQTLRRLDLNRAIDDLAWIADHAQQIADRANADVDDTQACAHYDGDHRGSADLTHPERHAQQRLDHPDQVYETMVRFAGMLRQTLDDARTTRQIAGQLTTSQDEQDRRTQSSVAGANPTAGYGYCNNCGRRCPGTINDRIKAGRCSPGCYEYHLRHGTERPREEY
jgi:hypothetical protein